MSSNFNLLKNGFFAPLTHLSIIQVEGEDAAQFLHSQFSNDIVQLAPHQLRFAGYCTAKGRLLATLFIWQTNNCFFLQLPTEIASTILKRLQMFVLRAKVRLTLMDSENVLLGIGGTKAPTILEKWFNLPEPMHITEDNMGTLLRHPDALEVPFFQWLIPSQQLNQILPELSHVLSMGSEATWDLSRIYAGIPQIELATQEQFVPQSVNLELIHGVSFKKGCYPGQEIVARMHYLGKPKRRMLCATIHTPHAAPSMEVYSANDPSQPCGMIVNAEKNTDNEFICLVEIQLSALQHDIFLGSTAREQLHFHNLPYEISNE